MDRISDRERSYVSEVLDAEFRNSSGGMMTKRLEALFAEVFESKFAISFINGTATMHAALVAAGIGFGDEVIVPPLTMASTSFAVLHAGAVPVYADIDPNTWTLDPESVRHRISPRTKAIIAVALYGLAADMDALMEIGREHSLFVMDDAAQCFLGYYKGRVVGSLANASSFSFQSSKHLTSGEGGMITTDDESLATSIRRMNSLGYAAVSAGAGKGKIGKEVIQDPSYARHSSVGWNYRMPELCSAVALAQTERIQELVAVRRKTAEMFSQAIAGCSWLVPQHTPENCIHSYWTYVVRLADNVPFSWHDFRSTYISHGGDGLYGAWRLNYLEPAFEGIRFQPWQSQNFELGLCPIAEGLQPRLMQFKTNEVDPTQISRQVDALAMAILDFNR